jgi:hypothetical protein
MRIYYTAFLIAMLMHGSSSLAQTATLLASEMLPPGSTVNMHASSMLDVIDTTGQGSGQTWNFSTLQPTGTSSAIDILNPADAPHINSFPAANRVVYEGAIQRYIYYVLTEDHLQRIGSFQTALNTFTDPQRELEFPFMVGSSFSDIYSSPGTGGGTIQVTCLGSGSLQLPDGMYDDVLLVRYTFSTFFSNVLQYLWIDATNGAQLLIYVPPQAVSNGNVLYATSVTTGITAHAHQIEMRVHPLADGSLQLTYAADEQVMWSLIDVAGRALAHGILPPSNMAVSTTLITGGLPGGLFLLSLHGTSTGHRSAVRFFHDRP